MIWKDIVIGVACFGFAIAFIPGIIGKMLVALYSVVALVLIILHLMWHYEQGRDR